MQVTWICSSATDSAFSHAREDRAHPCTPPAHLDALRVECNGTEVAQLAVWVPALQHQQLGVAKVAGGGSGPRGRRHARRTLVGFVVLQPGAISGCVQATIVQLWGCRPRAVHMQQIGQTSAEIQLSPRAPACSCTAAPPQTCPGRGGYRHVAPCTHQALLRLVCR
jgi:hypothetical protein